MAPVMIASRYTNFISMPEGGSTATVSIRSLNMGSRRGYVEINQSVATPLGDGMITSRRCALVCGGYLASAVPSVSSYAEPMGHMPSVTGMVGVEFALDKHDRTRGIALRPLFPRAPLKRVRRQAAPEENNE